MTSTEQLREKVPASEIKVGDVIELEDIDWSWIWATVEEVRSSKSGGTRYFKGRASKTRPAWRLRRAARAKTLIVRRVTEHV